MSRGLGAVSLIQPGLWAGGLPGGSGLGLGVSWDELAEQQVDTIFSLTPDAPAPPHSWAQELHPLVDVAEAQQSGASRPYLERTTRRLSALLAARRRVYVHCQAGISRTGLVLTAWRMREAGEPREAALAWLQERRPCLEPNPGFWDLLSTWR